MSTMEDIGSQLPSHRPPVAKPDGEGPLPWLTLPDELKIKIMRTFVPTSISCTNYDNSRIGPVQRPDNEPWASRQALAAACLASRQLMTICSPLLFEVVALRNHREVMCFLRSLMGSYELRARVRRLAYVRLTRVDNNNRRIPEAAPTPKGLVAGDPASWPITSPDRALVNIFQLRAQDMMNDVDATQKALAVILAMLPRIEALFLAREANGFGFLGPSLTTKQHPVTRLLSPSLQSLSMLEEIIVDYSTSTHAWKLWFLILNCPRLRRVVLKGPIAFDARLSPREWKDNQLDSVGIGSEIPPIQQEGQLLSRAAIGNIRELLLYKSRRVKWDLLPKIFPNLERLVTVFADTGWRHAFWQETGNSPEPLKLSELLGQVVALYKSSLRSLTVTDFLRQNDSMSGGRRWDNSLGFDHVATIPPLLSPGLPQVPLVELTTDCVWLFGRDDTSISYEISALLPSSLVSLHLIDYWAVSVYEDGARMLIPPGTVVHQVPSEPRKRLKWVDYYPVFPSGLTPLEFLGKVFATLYESCANQHTQLKQITLSSPLFDGKGRWSRVAARPVNRTDWRFRSCSEEYGSGTKPVDRTEVQAWQARIGDNFARIGVEFSFTTMRELKKSMESSWACV